MELKRTCPKCNVVREFYSEKGYRRSLETDGTCRLCVKKGRLQKEAEYHKALKDCIKEPVEPSKVISTIIDSPAHKGFFGKCRGCKEQVYYYSAHGFKKANRLCRVCVNLKSYGLTKEQYNITYNYQKGCCAICKRHQSEFKRVLAVDHNHTTGTVRGLLCNNCNSALGLYQEKISTLKGAIAYLKKWNA